MNRITKVSALVTPALALTLSACGGDGGSASNGLSNYSPAAAMTGHSGPVGSSSGSYSIGGTVTGLSGSGLSLQLSDGDSLAVAADGTFTFPNALPNGTAYTVTVGSQPSVSREICGVSNGTGTVSTVNVTNVTIDCSTMAGFLYQLSAGTADRIYSYGISTGTGQLIPFGQPTATAPFPWAIAVAPGGKYVYVTNVRGADNNTSNLPGSISTFAVNSATGGLTLVGPPITVGTGEGATGMAISAGGYLFVYDYNGANIASNTPAGPQSLIEYALDPSTGAPSLIGTVLTEPVNAATRFVVTPDGRFLYVLTGSPESSPATANTLTVYAIDPTSGALTPGASIAPGNDVTALTMDPKGRFLFLTNSVGTPFQESGTVQSYTIDSSSGALTAIGAATSVVSNGGGLCADPSGNFLYLASNLNWTPSTDTVQALSVDPSIGSVSTIGSIIQTQGAPNLIACDPSGQFVFVQTQPDSGSGSLLTTFTISSDPGSLGQLTASGTSQSPLGMAGTAIAIVE